MPTFATVEYEPFVISCRGMPGQKGYDPANIITWFEVTIEFDGRKPRKRR